MYWLISEFFWQNSCKNQSRAYLNNKYKDDGHGIVCTKSILTIRKIHVVISLKI